MRKIIEKFKDPTFWAGLGVAATSFNWASIMPMGSQAWWFSAFAFLGGIAAAVLKNNSGGDSN